MKKFWIMLLAAMPIGLWAQDNTWELPEEEQQEELEDAAKGNPDAKYLRGAVPLVDGKVVFTKTIEAPGKSADQIYTILHDYMLKMTKAKNQINSHLVIEDAEKHELGAVFHEWLVFKDNVFNLDRTHFNFQLHVSITDGKADVSLDHITYDYDLERKPQHYTAEEWITDKYAVNKKHTKLYPISSKFRRKTIDRKDFIFNKFNSLINE